MAFAYALKAYRVQLWLWTDVCSYDLEVLQVLFLICLLHRHPSVLGSHVDIKIIVDVDTKLSALSSLVALLVADAAVVRRASRTLTRGMALLFAMVAGSRERLRAIRTTVAGILSRRIYNGERRSLTQPRRS
ncbi:hypothetical protein EJ06DRAFT_52425 [Trichodelitschia bisporula]|uniref:Uncharacterized protein n=1 Tax=Trichodelitschia bisporula TaxID=703511 RepID=A0A6G1HUM9_9PEZI|nr:hypothetical protein EJ06DRAFT_52425 [Trichodelitschia bisporula]